MSALSRFAYPQARMQARYGALPDGRGWQRLASIHTLSHFLQTARTTGLRPWLYTLGQHSDHHEMERALRRLYRQHIDEVAAWQPAPWRPAVAWLTTLIDLPAIQHLLSGQTAPNWVQQDPQLKAYTHEVRSLRLQALEDSPYAPLLAVLQEELTLLQAWRRHWQSLWPSMPPAQQRSLEQFSRHLSEQHAALSADAAHESWRAREWLEARLRREFRRHTHQPVTAFIYLALVGLNLERLRALLMQLSLFGQEAEA